MLKLRHWRCLRQSSRKAQLESQVKYQTIREIVWEVIGMVFFFFFFLSCKRGYDLTESV